MYNCVDAFVEMMSCTDTVRDGCRHKIVVTALCRYCRNKPYRNVLVLVVPACFKDVLVDIHDPTVNRF